MRVWSHSSPIAGPAPRGENRSAPMQRAVRGSAVGGGLAELLLTPRRTQDRSSRACSLAWKGSSPLLISVRGSGCPKPAAHAGGLSARPVAASGSGAVARRSKREFRLHARRLRSRDRSVLGVCARSRRTVAALAARRRVRCAPRTLTSQPDHGETAQPEDANNALRPKAGLPRQPGSHPLLATSTTNRAAAAGGDRERSAVRAFRELSALARKCRCDNKGRSRPRP